VTPFGEIMKRTVEETPEAIGGAFAAPDGEMVDSFAMGIANYDWAILTAHYGVILSLINASFGLWHFGGPEYFVARHAQLDIVVHTIEGGYYALLALERRDTPSEEAEQEALASLRVAAMELTREMA
jgi:hypothetical protein